MRNESVTFSISEDDRVSGILSIPDSGARDIGVIIAHGAANDMNHPMLQFLADGLADAGYLSLRFNFLYREKGAESLDTLDLLYLAWQGAYRFLAGHPEFRPRRIVAVGKSLGGRIASLMAAEGRLSVERLIFLGYPLHAPGKKDRLRDGPLYEISIPMFFFAGSRDQFCDLQLLKGVLSRLKAPWELDVIEEGEHSFDIPDSHDMTREEVYRRLLSKTLEWLKA